MPRVRCRRDDLKTLHTPRVRTRVVNTPGSDSMTANSPPIRSCSFLSSGVVGGKSGSTRLGEASEMVPPRLNLRVDSSLGDGRVHDETRIDQGKSRSCQVRLLTLSAVGYGCDQ